MGGRPEGGSQRQIRRIGPTDLLSHRESVLSPQLALISHTDLQSQSESVLSPEAVAIVLAYLPTGAVMTRGSQAKVTREVRRTSGGPTGNVRKEGHGPLGWHPAYGWKAIEFTESTCPRNV